MGINGPGHVPLHLAPLCRGLSPPKGANGCRISAGDFYMPQELAFGAMNDTGTCNFKIDLIRTPGRPHKR